MESITSGVFLVVISTLPQQTKEVKTHFLIMLPLHLV